MSAAKQFLLLLLIEHQGRVSALSKEFKIALAGENLTTKRETAGSLHQAIQNFLIVIPGPYVPQWLTFYESNVGRFASGHLTCGAILDVLFEVLPQLKSQTWNLDDDIEPFDFDSLFQDARNHSKLPELFDQVIKLLEQLRDSGAIDSVAMTRALNKIIATLQKGKQGSFMSLHTAWEFFKLFFQNYLWLELGRLPVLGSVFEALKSTIDETEAEVRRVAIQLHSTFAESVNRDLRLSPGNSNYSLELYTREGNSTAVSARPSAIKA